MDSYVENLMHVYMSLRYYFNFLWELLQATHTGWRCELTVKEGDVRAPHDVDTVENRDAVDGEVCGIETFEQPRSAGNGHI